MAAAQSAEQKAAAEKAAAEKQAAEQKAAEEAAAKAAADAEGDETDESEPEGTRYVVSGVVAVIRTKDGSERYLYRGARIDAGAFDEESLEHLVGIGLISEAE